MKIKLRSNCLPGNTIRAIQSEIVNELCYLPDNVQVKIAQQSEHVAKSFAETTLFPAGGLSDISDLSALLIQTADTLLNQADDLFKIIK